MSIFMRVTQRGSFRNIERFLRQSEVRRIRHILEKYGAQGVTALSEATPVDSSLTANSWTYEVVQRPGYHSVRWYNTNRENGSNVAILLQYGHATRSGSWVEGRDYVNPAIRPIFDKILEEAWREVTSANH